MKAEFDYAAEAYDSDFTYSRIGILQRERVWKYLSNAISQAKHLEILELNCGTGEDAKKFAEYNFNVTATDISDEMLKMAKQKNQSENINFLKKDLNKITSTDFQEKFDLVFSNFGGLNCIDEKGIVRLGNEVNKILKHKGSFVAVIMPSFSIIETFYFLLKFQINKAFRRSKKFVFANVSGQKVKTWYYSPKNFAKLMPSDLHILETKPIGLFLPPSYLEPFFIQHSAILASLNKLENWLGIFAWQAKVSDHYYIKFTKK